MLNGVTCCYEFVFVFGLFGNNEGEANYVFVMFDDTVVLGFIYVSNITVT